MKTLNDYIDDAPGQFRQEELILEATELIARVMNQTQTTKSQLAKKLGTSKPHVSQCLSGEQNLTLRTLADLFGALGYRMDVGATPLDCAVGKSVSRLYPIGGWSFEKACSDQISGVIDCAASLESTNEDYSDLQEAAA